VCSESARSGAPLANSSSSNTGCGPAEAAGSGGARDAWDERSHDPVYQVARRHIANK